MTSVIYLGKRAVVVRVGDRIHYLGALRHNQTYITDIRISGTCASCDGPYILPEIDDAMAAVHAYAAKQSEAKP